jgi:(p)ppGpp synthase/HD superfamily hydrolase
MKEKAVLKHEKLKVAIKYWLLGRKYYASEKALEFGATHHTGVRKDNLTPEFFHQITMAHYARVFDGILLYPEETFSSIFLHDIIEDKDVTYVDIKDKFGSVTADAVSHLSRKIDGKKIDIKDYYSSIKNDPIASVAKGIDRINNMQTMVDVFTVNGQKWYIEETETYILPMLKHARIHFVEQERIYECLKLNLMSQVDLIKAIHKAQGV